MMSSVVTAPPPHGGGTWMEIPFLKMRIPVNKEEYKTKTFSWRPTLLRDQLVSPGFWVSSGKSQCPASKLT